MAELRDQLRGNAWAFLASGSAHEFGDVTAEARAIMEPIEAGARQRARHVLERTARAGGITIVLPDAAAE